MESLETNEMMTNEDGWPRRKNIRLQNYDYSMPGDYFVTIVTQGRQCLFGDIDDDGLRKNDASMLVENCFRELADNHEGIDCLDHVVMPNHFHCILRLRSGNLSLSQLVRVLKSKTTVGYIQGVRQKGWPPFDGKLWQKGFYEHIIRRERVFDYIRNYIYRNPERWYYDHLNPNCSSVTDNIIQGIKDLYG